MAISSKSAFELEVIEIENCPLCGAGQAKTLYKKKCPGLNFYGKIARCLTCGFVYSKTRFTPEGVKAFYELKYQSGNYRHYRDFKEIKITNFEEKIRSIMVLSGIKGGRFLDIGCGEGFALLAAQKFGFETTGVETSEKAVQRAWRSGRKDIYQIDFEDIENLGLGQFDMVTLFDVMDHLADPQKVIWLARNHLRPSGILHLDISDIGSFYHTILRGHYFNIQPFEHLSYFSKESIRTLLEKNDFHVLSLTTDWRRFNLHFVEMTIAHFMPRLYRLLMPFFKILPEGIKGKIIAFPIGVLQVTARKIS